jgi:hypothetical protein
VLVRVQAVELQDEVVTGEQHLELVATVSGAEPDRRVMPLARHGDIADLQHGAQFREAECR